MQNYLTLESRNTVKLQINHEIEIQVSGIDGQASLDQEYRVNARVVRLSQTSLVRLQVQ